MLHLIKTRRRRRYGHKTRVQPIGPTLNSKIAPRQKQTSLRTSPRRRHKQNRNHWQRVLRSSTNKEPFVVLVLDWLGCGFLEVLAHALFYFTGIGITVLLMNLLIGVLGNNFELYQDRSDVLFQRARAKMMLELRDRLSRRLSKWILSTLSMLMNLGRIVKERLMEYKCGRLALLVAFLPFLVFFLLIRLIRLSCLRMLPEASQCAIQHALGHALGYGGERSDTRMEDCSIFLVLRAEPPLEDLRELALRDEEPGEDFWRASEAVLTWLRRSHQPAH